MQSSCSSLQVCLPNGDKWLKYLGRSGNTEASKDWNLNYIQDRAEDNSGAKLGGYDRDGQWRHCDSKGCEN
jgi:hypothetical protein